MSEAKFTDENIEWLRGHGFTSEWNGYVRIVGDVVITVSAYKNIFGCHISHKEDGILVTASSGLNMEDAIVQAVYKCNMKLAKWLGISNAVKDVFCFDQFRLCP